MHRLQANTSAGAISGYSRQREFKRPLPYHLHFTASKERTSKDMLKYIPSVLMPRSNALHYHLPNSLTPLVLSLKYGDIDDLRQQLEINEMTANDMINGRYPLHFAAEYGHPKMIEYLVSCSANVNVKDAFGITPLLAAIWEGQARCVEVLLKAGANAKELAPDGKTYEESAEKEEIKEMLHESNFVQEQSCSQTA